LRSNRDAAALWRGPRFGGVSGKRARRDPHARSTPSYDRAEQARTRWRRQRSERTIRARQPLESDDRCDSRDDVNAGELDRSRFFELDAYEDTNINCGCGRGYGRADGGLWTRHCRWPAELARFSLIDKSGKTRFRIEDLGLGTLRRRQGDHHRWPTNLIAQESDPLPSRAAAKRDAAAGCRSALPDKGDAGLGRTPTIWPKGRQNLPRRHPWPDTKNGDLSP